MYYFEKMKKIAPEPVKNIFRNVRNSILVNSALYVKYVDSVTLEVTSACNLHCPVCNIPNLKRAKGFMSLDDFKKIADKLPSRIKLMRMNFAGEPLLNRDVFKMIAYSKSVRPDIKIHISTNATRLDKFQPEEIINSGLDSIAIAIEGDTKQIHESYRRGSSFEAICRAAENLCGYKKSVEAEKPVIIQQTLLHKASAPRIPEIVKLSRSIGFDELHLRFISLPVTDSSSEYFKKRFSLTEEDVNTLNKKFITTDEYSQYEVRNGKYFVKKENKKCSAFTAPVIFWNGDVTICCFDDEGDFVYGNILEENFDDIVKKMPVKNIYNRELPICKYCTISSLGIDYDIIKL
ncbi:MAG: radical SAM protein [Elusimicrobia bacterium]|nr:radical SAM protein [Elusimicrobiota bacterium]